VPNFGAKSKQNLSEAHINLQRLFTEVIKHRDCTVVVGYRGEAEQNRAFAVGNSKLKFPNSKHNQSPSLAVDVVPYINGGACWDTKECYAFGGFVMGVASQMGIKIRY